MFPTRQNSSPKDLTESKSYKIEPKILCRQKELRPYEIDHTSEYTDSESDMEPMILPIVQINHDKQEITLNRQRVFFNYTLSQEAFAFTINHKIFKKNPSKTKIRIIISSSFYLRHEEYDDDVMYYISERSRIHTYNLLNEIINNLKIFNEFEKKLKLIKLVQKLIKIKNGKVAAQYYKTKKNKPKKPYTILMEKTYII
jgi:hypothetical protein